MQVSLDTKYSPNFNAKVSPKFINAMRGFINGGENRLKNNYRLNNKIQDYANFGYDNFTIELVQLKRFSNNDYFIIASEHDKKANEGIFLAKRRTFRQATEKFLSIRKHEFDILMKKNQKFSSK